MDAGLAAMTHKERELDSLDPIVAEAIHRQLSHVEEFGRRLEVAVRASAAPTSLAAEDGRLPEARLVRLYAPQSLAASVDHLLAWRLIIERRVIPVAAHVTLLRAALEGAVRCRWHVDPTVDSGTRVGRAVAARRDDQVERASSRLWLANRQRATPRCPHPA